VATGGSFLAVKRPGRETDHSPPSCTEVKNAWSYTCTPPYVFEACCLIKHRDNFTLPYRHSLTTCWPSLMKINHCFNSGTYRQR